MRDSRTGSTSPNRKWLLWLAPLLLALLVIGWSILWQYGVN